MKVLVTGGGGFIGRHIVAQLAARGDEVTVLARGDYPALDALGVRRVRADIQDAAAVERACTGMDAVFHVAARAGIWGARAAFHGPNVTGTENVIHACRERGVAKLVFTSSPAVVFDGRAHRGCDEALPYPERYRNFYSETNAIAERLVTAANGSDLLTVSLRPHLVIGPGDPHLLPRLIARARRRRLVRVGNGENRVDITFVEDVARAHLLAADALAPESPVAGSVYFITQNDPVRLWAWVAEVLKRLSLPPVKRHLPLPAALGLGAILEALYATLHLPGEPRLTRFLAAELGLDHYYDITRARRELGYQPQVSSAQALTRTLGAL